MFVPQDEFNFASYVLLINLKDANALTNHKEGVPQGSVLGPFAFTMYSSALEDIIYTVLCGAF